MRLCVYVIRRTGSSSKYRGSVISMSSKERVGNMLCTPLECPSQELGDWTASVYFPGIRWLEIAWLEGLRESSLT